MTNQLKAKVYTASLSASFCEDIVGGLSVFNSSKYAVFPGFCDVHVHFREPGFSYKETMETGSRASARGGYTAVCTMPNLNPVPDSVENLRNIEALLEQLGQLAKLAGLNRQDLTDMILLTLEDIL